MSRERGGIRGILAPVVTPFGNDGALSREAFSANLAAHLVEGLHGILLCGSTGEAALLTEAERRTLVEWARPLVPADRWLVVGVGGESTRQTISRCHDADEHDADAVLCVAPHYYGAQMTEAALLEHFTRVADASPLPVLLYNIPKHVHFALSPELVARLATHENVVGMKDSSGDLALLRRYLAAQSPTFDVLTGSGQTIGDALMLGARGGILAVSLFATGHSLEVWRAFERGEPLAIRAAQEKLVPLAREIVGRLGVPGIKRALDHVGLSGGAPRLPLLPLDEDGARYVGRLLRDAQAEFAG